MSHQDPIVQNLEDLVQAVRPAKDLADPPLQLRAKAVVSLVVGIQHRVKEATDPKAEVLAAAALLRKDRVQKDPAAGVLEANHRLVDLYQVVAARVAVPVQKVPVEKGVLKAK